LGLWETLPILLPTLLLLRPLLILTLLHSLPILFLLNALLFLILLHALFVLLPALLILFLHLLDALLVLFPTLLLLGTLLFLVLLRPLPHFGGALILFILLRGTFRFTLLLLGLALTLPRLLRLLLLSAARVLGRLALILLFLSFLLLLLPAAATPLRLAHVRSANEHRQCQSSRRCNTLVIYSH